MKKIITTLLLLFVVIFAPKNTKYVHAERYSVIDEYNYIYYLDVYSDTLDIEIMNETDNNGMIMFCCGIYENYFNVINLSILSGYMIRFSFSDMNYETDRWLSVYDENVGDAILGLGAFDTSFSFMILSTFEISSSGYGGQYEFDEWDWDEASYIYGDLFSTIWKYNDENLSDAYNEGYNEGFDIGNFDGYSDGYNEGYANGSNEGYEAGSLIGFNEGVSQGTISGRDSVLNDPNTYNLYTQQQYDAHGGAFDGVFGFLKSIALGLKPILDIELFSGITLGMVIAVPIVFSIVAFIVNLFR